MDSTDPDLALVAAFARIAAVDFDRWPNVATRLLEKGYDGDALITLAGLDLAPFDPWVTDRLVPRMLAELESPDVGASEALSAVASAVARLAVLGWLSNEYATQLLAQLYIEADYPQHPAELGQL